MSTNRRRHVAVVNPQSGRGRARQVFTEAKAVFDRHSLSIELYPTQSAAQALDIARGLTLTADDVVIAVGGDGTIHQIVNGLMARSPAERPTLGVLPGGTGNSLAHDLGCTSAPEAASRIVAGRVRCMDVIEVQYDDEIRHAFNIVGWGLAATAGLRARGLRWLGAHRYLAASLVEIGLAEHAEAELDGGRLSGVIPLAMASNTQHTGTGMRIAPDARLDDGLLDVIVVKPVGRRAMLRLLRSIDDGSHVHHDAVSYRQAPRFSIKSAGPRPLNIDGEIVEATMVDARVIPGAVRLLS